MVSLHCAADFGLSVLRPSSVTRLPRNQCSLSYRAPELLFAIPNYTSAVDLW